VNHLHDAKNDYTKLVNPDSNDGMGSSLALAAKKLIEFPTCMLSSQAFS